MDQFQLFTAFAILFLIGSHDQSVDSAPYLVTMPWLPSPPFMISSQQDAGREAPMKRSDHNSTSIGSSNQTHPESNGDEDPTMRIDMDAVGVQILKAYVGHVLADLFGKADSTGSDATPVLVSVMNIAAVKQHG